MSLESLARRRIASERLPRVSYSSLHGRQWMLSAGQRAFWVAQVEGAAVEPEKLGAAFERMWAATHGKIH